MSSHFLTKKTSRQLKSLQQQPKVPLQNRSCTAHPAAPQLQVLIPGVVCERCISLVFCCTDFRRFKFHCGLQAKQSVNPCALWDKPGSGTKGLEPSWGAPGRICLLEKNSHTALVLLWCRGLSPLLTGLQPHRRANPESSGALYTQP